MPTLSRSGAEGSGTPSGWNRKLGPIMTSEPDKLPTVEGNVKDGCELVAFGPSWMSEAMVGVPTGISNAPGV